MASAAIVQMARTRAPLNLPGDAANDFNVRIFDVTATSQAHAVPANWAGKVVRIYFIGTAATDVAVFGFSKNSAAVLDGTQTGSAAGQSTSAGLAIADKQFMDFHLPTKQGSESIYFVRDAKTGTGTAYLLLASD